MLTKIISVVVKLFTVAPHLIADVESDISKIRSDTTLLKRIEDALAALEQVLSDVVTALGL